MEDQVQIPATPPPSGPNVRRVMAYTAAVGATLLGFYLLYRVLSIIVLFFFCIIIATALEPVVTRLRHGPFSRIQGIIVIYVVIFAIIGGIITLTVPVVVNAGSSFVNELPSIQRRAVDEIGKWGHNVFTDQATDFIRKFDFSQVSKGSGAEGMSLALDAASFVFQLVIAFVLIFYWLVERVTIKRSLTSYFSTSTASKMRRVWDDIEEKVGAWVRGQLFLMIFIGVAAAIVYTLMGLEYVPVLALIAGLFELVPVVGPWLAAVPTIVITITYKPEMLVWVLVYSVVIQLFEGNFLVPRVMGETVGVSPLLVLVSLLIGETIAGVTGALLAVPLAAAIQVTIQDIRRVAAEEVGERKVIEPPGSPNVSGTVAEGGLGSSTNGPLFGEETTTPEQTAVSA